MIIKEGCAIRTPFLVGKVIKVFEGGELGWEDQHYLLVRVILPRLDKYVRKEQIVRLDEVVDVYER